MAPTIEDAKALFNARDYVRSEAICRSILSSVRQHRDAEFYLALCLLRTRRLIEARRILEVLVRRDPRDHPAEYNLALVLVEIGDAKAALAAVDHILLLDPSNERALRKRAELVGKARSSSVGYEDTFATSGTRETEADAQAAPLPKADPGRLLFEGHRSLASYVQRFLMAGVLIAVSLAIITNSVDIRAFAHAVPGIESVRSRLEIARSTNSAPFIAELEREMARALSIESTVLQVFAYLAVLLILAAVVIVVLSLLGPGNTSYRFFETRIVIREGVLQNQTRGIWLYEITDISVETPLALKLVGTARLRIQTSQTQSGPAQMGGGGSGVMGSNRGISITGFASTKSIGDLRDDLDEAIHTQRLRIKRFNA